MSLKHSRFSAAVPIPYVLRCAVCGLLSSGSALATQEGPPTPATCVPVSVSKPAPPSTPQPDTSQAAKPPSETDIWLDRIENRASQVKTLKAKLRYDRIQNLIQSTQIRHGTLQYVAGPPAGFAIQFKVLIENGRRTPQNNRYIFDGRWLVERYENQKLFIKQKVVEDGRSDPLAIGAGPFPLPVTFKKGQILKRFEVSIIPYDLEKDPKNSVHLKLWPKSGQRITFTEIHLWYDRDTLLPLRLRTLDESDSESTVHLKKVKVNEHIASDATSTAEPKQPGWRVEFRSMEKKKSKQEVKAERGRSAK